MSKDKPTLYYDVTQLVHWPGKLTGIPRVMYELATRFAHDEQTVFVTWVNELQGFCEVNFLSTMSHRGKGVDYGPNQPAANEPMSEPAVSKTSTKQRIAYLTKKVSPAVHAKLVHRYQNTSLKQHLVDIQAHDQLFIPWGEWWDESFTAYISRLQVQDVQVIQVIHDMATTLQPQFFESVKADPTDYNRAILPRCALVLAVSQNTKKELTMWLEQEKLPIPPIKVFREGDDFEVAKALKPRDERFTQSGLKGNDYVLAVGTVEVKKNHQLYYYVYKMAARQGIDLPKMVIVGRKGWGTETTIDLLNRDPEIKDKFVLLHDTSDEELSWLYEHCLFTVLASFHEGWGIPIAESIARGAPCLCSNTSSMVEVVPGYAEHFNPLSPEECLKAMQRLLEPKVLAAARKKAKTYTQFSWDESYQQVAKLVQEVAHA